MSAVAENPLALAVVVEGKVLSSNLPEFRDAVKRYVGEINRDLITDDQFVQAQQDVKTLQSMEDAIKGAKEKALRDAEQLHALFSQLDDIGEIPREARLSLSRLIESKKESIKAQMIADALNKLICAPHLRLRNFKSVVENSIKGKRTLESMEKALDIIVGSLNSAMAASKAVIAEWEKVHEETVPDADTLMLEQAEAVRLKLQARTQARIEAQEKKRLSDEAEKERQARLKAEAIASQQTAAPAEATTTAPANAAPPSPPTTTAYAPAAAAPEGESEAEELARICALVRSHLVSLKPVLDGAVHTNNILRIRAFRAAVNPAFTEMQRGGAQ